LTGTRRAVVAELVDAQR